MYQEKRLLNGFLDNDLQLEVKKMRTEHGDIYKIIEKINKLFYGMKKIMKKLNQQMLMCILEPLFHRFI